MNFDWKIIEKGENNLIKKCCIEKVNMNKKELYSKEKERFFNRNGWGIEEVERMKKKGMEIEIENKIRERERDIMGQTIDSKTKEARYNRKYKEIGMGRGKPEYLRKNEMDKKGIGDGIRALIRLRCGKMEDNNKYWVEKDKKICRFCKEGKDKIEHYLVECIKVREY